MAGLCHPSGPRTASHHLLRVLHPFFYVGLLQVLPDVLVFNPATRTWRQAEVQGEVHLLKRTAHGACIHPLRPRSILLMGGYGGPGEDFRWAAAELECAWYGGITTACAATRGGASMLRVAYAWWSRWSASLVFQLALSVPAPTASSCQCL